jgi:hypothetical protein
MTTFVMYNVSMCKTGVEKKIKHLKCSKACTTAVNNLELIFSL